MNKEVKTINEIFIPINFIINRISKSNLKNKETLKCIALSLSIEVLKSYNIPFTGKDLNNYLNTNTTISYPNFEKLSDNNDYFKTMFNLYHIILSIDNYESIIDLINKNFNYNIDIKNDTNYRDLLNTLKNYIWPKTKKHKNITSISSISVNKLIKIPKKS